MESCSLDGILPFLVYAKNFIVNIQISKRLLCQRHLGNKQKNGHALVDLVRDAVNAVKY